MDVSFSENEAAAAVEATTELRDKHYKTTLEEGVEGASEWGAEQSKPWYRRIVVWKWVIGTAAVAGAGTYLYFKVYKPRKRLSGKRGV